MRLLALPEHTQELLKAGAISAGHARALLAMDNPDAIADKIVARGLTVRDVEKLNSGGQSLSSEKVSVELDFETRELVRKLSLALGVDADIKNRKKSCVLRFTCKNWNNLNIYLKNCCAINKSVIAQGPLWLEATDAAN